jgi:hypothetical protein
MLCFVYCNQQRDAVARGNRLASFRGTEAAACGDNNVC